MEGWIAWAASVLLALLVGILIGYLIRGKDSWRHKETSALCAFAWDFLKLPQRMASR